MLDALRKDPEDDERPRPSLKRLRDVVQGPFGVRSLALTGLLDPGRLLHPVLRRSFFLPIVLALLLSFLLSPVVRALNRLRIPNGLGAVLVVFGLLGGLGVGGLRAVEPGLRMGAEGAGEPCASWSASCASSRSPSRP